MPRESAQQLPRTVKDVADLPIPMLSYRDDGKALRDAPYGWVSQGSMGMELRIESHQAFDVLCISGRLDLVSSSALKDTIRQRLSERRVQFVIDMEKVTFINSSGLGALISALRDVRLSDGRVVLCRLAPYIEEIFTLTGLTRVFDCYGSVADSLESFANPPKQVAGKH